MSKKPVSWLELIKLKLNDAKSKGQSPSINDIMPEAKKEWVQIKAGTHPTYMQGKSQTFARKKKTGDGAKKTRKADKKNSSASASASSARSASAIQDVLDQVKMCGKCKKKVEQLLSKKNMTGGYNPFYDAPSVGDATAAPANLPPQNDQVAGFDKNVPSYSFLGGGKGKRGKKQKKGGGCGGVCVGGGGAAVPAAV